MNTPEAAQRHANRYGTRPPVRRRWLAIVLGAVIVVVGSGIAYLGFQKYGPGDIQTKQLGYTVVDDSTMTVRMRITRDDPSKAVVCFVRAMDRDGAEVGRREVLITPSGYGTVEVPTFVRSSSRASASSIYGCTFEVPDYLRTE